jgi:outer membrane beta-barrel protein
MLVLAGPARAQSKPSEAPVPSCMDQSISSELGEELRPRGVQKRRFLKQGQLEITARGGLFASDLLSSSYALGGALSLFFTEDFAIDLSFDVTPVALDLDAPVAEFFGDERFEPGLGYLGMASLLWSPIHAKLKVGGGIVHTDLYLIAGAGRLFHDSVQGVTFNAGMGLDMLTTQWVTFRFELRDVMAVQEAVAETRFTNNLMATVGVALWLPTGL